MSRRERKVRWWGFVPDMTVWGVWRYVVKRSMDDFALSGCIILALL